MRLHIRLISMSLLGLILVACQTEVERIREANEALREGQQPTQTSANLHSLNLEEGDCINFYSTPDFTRSTEIEDVEAVLCSGEWEYRVVSRFLVPLGNQYPGVHYFEQQAFDQCDRRHTVFIYPSMQAWDLGGDRVVRCLQESYGLSVSDPERLDNIIGSGIVREQECYNEYLEFVELVPCTSEWQYRVVSIFSAGNSEAHPSENTFLEQAYAHCDRRFSLYLSPSLETWETGDRNVVCIQESYGLSLSNPDKLERIVNSRSLDSGECFNEGRNYMERVSCSDSWEYKVTSIFKADADGFYPGEQYFEREIEDRCGPISSTYIFPSSETWATGDRNVICLQER